MVNFEVYDEYWDHYINVQKVIDHESDWQKEKETWVIISAQFIKDLAQIKTDFIAGLSRTKWNYSNC